jgi:benzoylformate decarboxylase
VGVAIRQLIELLPQTERQAPSAPEKPPVPEPSSPISVEYLMYVLSKVLPEDAMVADESASSKAKLHRHVRPSRPGGYLTSAAGGLGYCLPAAVGLKLAQSERPVVCVIGDGSVSYSIQALWSAARYETDVVVVVVNNRGYSILKGFRDAIGIDDTVPGLDVSGIDFLDIAGGFGAGGERVEKAEDLKGALRRAFAAGRPYLLDVLVDPTVPKLLS